MIKCCLNWQRNKRLGIKNWYACTNSLLGLFSRIDSPDWQFNFYYRSSTQWWVENSRWSSQSLLWEYSLWSCFFGIKEPDRKWNFFFVCVSKGGIVQEPDRTIFLEFVNGHWEVVNEGYWLDSLSCLQEQNAHKNSPRYSARKFSALLSKV